MATTRKCGKCKGTGAHWAGACYPCGGTGRIVILSAADKAQRATEERAANAAYLASPAIQARERRAAERAARQAVRFA